MKLTPKQAAARQSVSVGLVYRLCATRRLAHFRVGAVGRGKILIDEADLDAILATRKVMPTVLGPAPLPSTSPPAKFRHLKLK